MSLVIPNIDENGFKRKLGVGDVVGGGEVIGTLTTAGDGTLTAALMTGFSILSRTGPTGAYNDTTDTAANIINALAVNYQQPSPGTTYRWRHLNTVAFIATMVAGTGVTLAGVTAVAASSYRDYLITLTNTTPTQVFAATVDGSTKVITGMTAAQTALLSVGMAVTGTGIAASSVIQSIQPGVGVTVNNNTTAAGTLVALTFSPTVTITGIGGGLK